MPTNVFLLALAAGLVSAVVFASATTGALLLRVVLFFLTPLSLYLAGLGLGTVAAAIAAITATATVLLMANPLAAEVYAISTALPAVVCTRLALLSREQGEVREWYPIGRIVVIAAVFAGIFAMIALMLMGGDVDTLTKMLRTVVESFVKTELAEIPGAPEINADQIDEITRSTLSSLPWALGLLAMATILSKSLARRAHHAGVRPPDASLARSCQVHDAGARHVRAARCDRAEPRRRHDRTARRRASRRRLRWHSDSWGSQSFTR